MSTITYFAYGSNMSSRRLRARVPSATPIGIGMLNGYRLVFDRPSPKDGSGKCDVTESPSDCVFGVLFDIEAKHKMSLDRVEGLDHGWSQTPVNVIDPSGVPIEALTYRALRTLPARKPYTWYIAHVLAGAREFGLARDYISAIEQVDAVRDPDSKREAAELAIHR